MLKLGAVERNVAVCWTMVIVGRYRAATAILRKSLDGKLLTRFSQKLAPLIGCWLVKKQNVWRDLGSLAKWRGIEKLKVG